MWSVVRGEREKWRHLGSGAKFYKGIMVNHETLGKRLTRTTFRTATQVNEFYERWERRFCKEGDSVQLSRDIRS